jgi:hypothetical protein
MADLKELLKAAKDRCKREPVPADVLDALGLPREGATFFVAECSARDLDSYQAGRWRQVGEGRHARAELDLTNERARLLVRCLVDENGERIFGDDDVAIVAEWPATVASDTAFVFGNSSNQNGGRPWNFGATVNIDIDATSTGANLDQATQGSADLWLKYAILP